LLSADSEGIMIDISQIDYSAFDRSEILMFLFHPRPEWGSPRSTGSFEDLLIPVEGDVAIGARFHRAGDHAPTILFFHGNGEIVADYDDLAQLYLNEGINFLAVDYRGYGRSSGRPTITAMMRDAHVVFDFVQNMLEERNQMGPFILMGRSLGSASVLELAAHYQERVDGLVVESGFAYSQPLLRLLGVDMGALGVREEDGFRNRDKMSSFEKPTLVIHAEHDHIIPLPEGQALYDASPATDKRLLIIPGANHNDIFMKGITEYMAAIREFVGKL
jgi:pimeloyl-ACP methyl ester carboxylesterase